MTLNQRVFVFAGLLGAMFGASAAMAFPVCAQSGGVTICNDNGVVTACSGSGGVGVCTDSNGHTNFGTTQGNTSIVTGTDGTHVWTNPTPPSEPDYDRYDRDRWDHNRWDHNRSGGWQEPSYPDTTPSYPDTTPSYPDTTPSYPDTSSTYPDTSSSGSDTTSNSVASLCVGTFSGKFASGEKVALQFQADGTILLRARGQAYPASGSCEIVAKKKAQFNFTLSSDSRYQFTGTIVQSAKGAKTVSGREIKAGKAIDKISLSASR